MIPQAYITEWSNSVPWQLPEQIEQDLVISRALAEIFSDDILSQKLAFRGGTALHKLFLRPQSRYSEDIDLVQTGAFPIGEVLDRLRVKLSFLGKGSVAKGDSMITMRFRFDSESQPSVKMKLKIETNGREHFAVLGYLQKPFAIDSRWFQGSADIRTYHLEELLGTKLRALYQRSKGRDLFDIYKAMTTTHLKMENILQCFIMYIRYSAGNVPSKKEYQMNLDRKILDSEFLGDTKGLLNIKEKYDPLHAYEIISKELIAKM